MLRFELKRALSGKAFLFALILGCAITLSDVFLNVIPEANNPNFDLAMAVKLGAYPKSVYSSWIGGQARTLQSTLFYLFIPLIAAIPFADSYCFDRAGYIKNIATRCSIRDYLISKYIAVFLSAGIAVSIPIIVNFIATAAVVPCLIPQASTFLFTIDALSAFDKIFYTTPFVYFLIYLVIDFVIAGLFAEIALVAVLVSKNRYVVIISPFAVYLALYFISGVIGIRSLSVFDMVRAVQVQPFSIIRFIVCIAILFAATFIPYYVYGSKDCSL